MVLNKAIEVHLNDAAVQEKAFGALWILAFNSENQVTIVDSGGIVEILHSMQNLQDNAAVQEKRMQSPWETC